MREDGGVIEVRPLGADDAAWKQATLLRAWGGGLVARRGAVVDATDLDGFVAVVDGAPAGLLTYAVEGDELEVVTINADDPGRGVGRALMDAARAKALEVGARRMWLITTNDNARAFRFYQRWGMDLAALHRDGVTESRALKPSIPLTGYDDVALRHELEFELLLLA
jgi:ribosomal protein S18 acetylase RimI-like enzyme